MILIWTIDNAGEVTDWVFGYDVVEATRRAKKEWMGSKAAGSGKESDDRKAGMNEDFNPFGLNDRNLRLCS